MAAGGAEWRILRWSSQLARGEVTHPTRGRLAFDAGVASVDSFTEGEMVDVELSAEGRVRGVRPRLAPPLPAYRAPEISIEPIGLLDFRFDSDEERDSVEDLVFERLGIAALSRDRGTHFLHEESALCQAMLEGLTGRDIEAFVRVDASYYFDWRRIGLLDPAFAPIWPRLPGLREIVDGGAIFFGPGTKHGLDEAAPLWGRTPPFLDAVFEPHALMVNGVCRESAWNAWHAALLKHTQHLPLQSW